jgi:hypothetical protein
MVEDNLIPQSTFVQKVNCTIRKIRSEIEGVNCAKLKVFKFTLLTRIKYY